MLNCYVFTFHYHFILLLSLPASEVTRRSRISRFCQANSSHMNSPISFAHNLIICEHTLKLALNFLFWEDIMSISVCTLRKTSLTRRLTSRINYFTIYFVMDFLINTLEKRHVSHTLSIDGRLFYITFNCVFPFIAALWVEIILKAFPKVYFPMFQS